MKSVMNRGVTFLIIFLSAYPLNAANRFTRCANAIDRIAHLYATSERSKALQHVKEWSELETTQTSEAPEANDFAEPKTNFTENFPNGRGLKSFDAMARINGLYHDIKNMEPGKVTILHAEGFQDVFDMYSNLQKDLYGREGKDLVALIGSLAAAGTFGGASVGLLATHLTDSLGAGIIASPLGFFGSITLAGEFLSARINAGARVYNNVRRGITPYAKGGKVKEGTNTLISQTSPNGNIKIDVLFSQNPDQPRMTIVLRKE